VNEDIFIRKLQRQSPIIGDDCAVIASPGDEDLLFTTDFTMEGVHFSTKTPATEVGHKAVARSLSDIAAMGGTPRYCLISLALSPSTSDRWLNSFYRGATRLLKRHGVTLAGGDISHTSKFLCDVMICGTIAKGKALLRSGARPGDVIYVSGPLGGWRHKHRIVPRLDIGRQLVGKATACMDISDGLSLDLHRLALASVVAAALESIPLIKGASLRQALHDGEDYELLYTARPAARVTGVRIGTIVQGKPGTITLNGKPVPQRGYDHFQHRS
jgi:thiamine-monophosphate kinase